MTDLQLSGRVIVTVEAADPGMAGTLGDMVARRLDAAGSTVFRASARDFVSGTEIDYPFLLAALVRPFRAGESFALLGSRPDGDILFDPLWTSAPRDACLVLDVGPGVGAVIDPTIGGSVSTSRGSRAS